MTFDKNGDGVLTLDELPERMHAMFARTDSNQDGKLTAEEVRMRAMRTGNPMGRRPEPGNAAGVMRMDPVLNALDVNHDGILSASEMRAAQTSLNALDVDHNGSLTPDEMRVRQQTPAERVAHVLDEFDTNKDGKLSLEEAPDGLRPRFASADANGDGVLDSAELLLMFRAAPQPSRNADTTGGQNPVSTDPSKGQH